MVKPVPEGYHTVTPFLNVKHCAEAIAFYQKAFGAEEKMRMAAPGGGPIIHAEIQIGDSRIMVSEATDRLPTHSSIFLYVNDCDAVWNRAVAAGATVVAPLADMFWGDRFGTLEDRFGNNWSIATHKEDVSPAEMQKRSAEAMAQMAQKK
jgi:PhnB protein